MTPIGALAIENPVPADVLRLFRRVFGAGAVGRPLRLSGGQHELYRIDVGPEAAVLKIIKDDAGALRRETRARELSAPWIPIPALLFQGRIRGSSRYLITRWADGVPLSTALDEPNFSAPALAGGTIQYVPNGSAWTFVGGAGLTVNGSAFTSGNPGAPQGNQVAFLQGVASVSQSVTFPGSALKPSGRRTVRSIHVEKAIGKSNPTNP